MKRKTSESQSHVLADDCSAYFDMSVHWAYVHILQPQFCMSQPMTVQVIHLMQTFMMGACHSTTTYTGKPALPTCQRKKQTPIKRSLIKIRMSLSCLETAGPPILSSPTRLTDSSSSARVASKVGSQSDC